MAAAGVPTRTLQEWMGHRDLQTTLVYADYAASPHEAAMLEKALAPTSASDELRDELRDNSSVAPSEAAGSGSVSELGRQDSNLGSRDQYNPGNRPERRSPHSSVDRGPSRAPDTREDRPRIEPQADDGGDGA